MTASAPARRQAVAISVLLVTEQVDADLLAWARGLREQLAVERGDVEVVLVQPAGEAPDEVWVAQHRHPALGADPGRGAAVWAGLHDSTGDSLVVVDVDRHSRPSPRDVLDLADALCGDVQLALGAADGGQDEPLAEHLVRPALALHHPHLASLRGVRPALWSVRREQLEMVPVPVGEGAELAALLDTDNLYGRDAVAEVLVSPAAQPEGLAAEGLMSGAQPTAGHRLAAAVQLLTVLERRLPQRLPFSDDPRAVPGCEGPVRVDECPPAAALPAYLPGLRARRG